MMHDEDTTKRKKNLPHPKRQKIHVSKTRFTAGQREQTKAILAPLLVGMR